MADTPRTSILGQVRHEAAQAAASHARAAAYDDAYEQGRLQGVREARDDLSGVRFRWLFCGVIIAVSAHKVWEAFS